MELLQVKDLSVNYGLIQAVRGVSFHVDVGEIVALIGANGAGKTSIMHAVSGILHKSGGEVLLNGVDITNYPGHKLVPMGMAHVPERRRIFQELTVLENLKLGAYTRRDKQEKADTLERVFNYFPVLKERTKQIAGTLSGGEQQMLAISRALMSHPNIMLLDEPSMGLSPLYVKTVFDIIKKINADGTTVLLVEQNAKQTLMIANRAYVLETGNITMEGSGYDLLNDEKVKKAYLGG